MTDDKVYINAEEGINRVMKNAKLFSKLLTKFKDEPHYTNLEKALAEGNMELARNSAHSLKGLAANLSLMELYKTVSELEAQIKAENVKDDQVTLVKGVYAVTLEEIDKVIIKYA